MRNWLLPEYIEDVLPIEASQIEIFRRSLLDLLDVNGYQLVMPPMLEYLESLITGVGHDLDLATFKVVDQLTGRLMGVRADITPQAARIDAHMLNNQGVTRLCYAGSVLRTNPSGLAQTRQPMQLGAELFGHAGIEADIEIQRLMVKTLQAANVNALQIDFSHVGIFDSLMINTHANDLLKQSIYEALQSKDKTELRFLTKDFDADIREALCRLTELNGDVSVLDNALRDLPKSPKIKQALNDLQQVANALADLGVGISFDLAELRGYHYHSGMVFAAYAQGYAGPLAFGGRYDEVGQAFGRARPATGFSLDLRGLVKSLPTHTSTKAILAPYGYDPELLNKIEALRTSGERVIQALPGHDAHEKELGCDRRLIHQAGQWQVVAA
ncbi:ATP phosphoribosyltransferase regulatory subunit [Candidatus Methylopumilus turicensis]|uniref:ATP phosphoribosyltransferase regulatory subunit n=1 Tax=Candidatus Methylopumilus turicensis TaxID=1581680 RepID=A0A0B7IU99_9PROT|nr:ATP phosphoribosyltransferase regulatory subunit [Candidatus Methylopumilus turicensis]CEN55880.1 ATP phosphoribosyltransferase regulatory subunit [Candidatus Methylopumilus turicensis]